MKTSTILTLIILFLSIQSSGFNLYAQTNNYLIKTDFITGATFPGMTTYMFSNNPTRGLKNKLFQIYPNFCFGVSLESSDLANLCEANLSLVIESLYGKASTGEVETYYGISKFTLTSLPIMFWTKLKTSGKLVPYVKVGIGTERTELIEKYNSREKSNFDLKKWFFSWGFGAGLDLNTFENITLTIFVDSVIKESGIAKKFDDFREIDYDFRNGVIFCGIQFGYKFN